MLTLLTLSRLIGTLYVRGLSDKGTVASIVESDESLRDLDASWRMFDEAPLPERNEIDVIAGRDAEYRAQLASVTTLVPAEGEHADRARWMFDCATHWSELSATVDGDWCRGESGRWTSACPLPHTIPSALAAAPITWREPADRRDPRAWEDAEVRRMQNATPRRERRMRDRERWLEDLATELTGIAPDFEPESRKVTRDESNWRQVGTRWVPSVGDVPYIRPRMDKPRPCVACKRPVEVRGAKRCESCNVKLASLAGVPEVLDGYGVTTSWLVARVNIVADLTHGRVTVRNASTGETLGSKAYAQQSEIAPAIARLVKYYESRRCYVAVQKIRPAERWLVIADYRTGWLTVRLDAKLARAGRTAKRQRYAERSELAAAVERVRQHFGSRHAPFRVWAIPAASVSREQQIAA